MSKDELSFRTRQGGAHQVGAPTLTQAEIRAIEEERWKTDAHFSTAYLALPITGSFYA